MSRKTLILLSSMAMLTLTLVACGGPSNPTVVSTPTVVVPAQNVLVSHDHFLAHTDPFAAVNPQNPRNVLSTAWLVLSPITYLVRIGTFASFDGAHTWHSNGMLPILPGYTESIDQTVAFNAQGIGFIAAVFRQNTQVSSASRIVVWRTDDGGMTFAQPLTIAIGAFFANPWVMVDTSTNPGTIYVAWRSGRTIVFSRSIDAGRTFVAPQVISTDATRPDSPVVTIGPSGMVQVVYVDYGLDAGLGAPVAVVISSDHGHTFGKSHLVPDVLVDYVVGAQNLSSAMAVASNPHSGMLYLAYAATRTASDFTNILLKRSSDGGKTWTTPQRVNDDPLNDQNYRLQPQVAVASDGTVDVSYFSIDENDLITTHLVQSKTQGASFLHSRQINSISWNLTSGVDAQFIGQRQGLAVGPNTIYPFWNDGRLGQLQIFTAAVPAQ